MYPWKIGAAVRRGAVVAYVVLALASPAFAQARDRLRIPVGRAEVVTSTDEVRTVAIAEPKIADAAVGSSRTVVVNAKSPGVTSLVIYNEGARFKVYDVEVYVPNSDKQVVLKVKVAEVNDNAKRELGFNYAGFGQSADPRLDGAIVGGLFTTKTATPSVPLLPGPTTDGAISYSRFGGNLDLQVAWKALEEKGDLRVLASPTLVACSGEKASFLAGGEFPVPIARSQGSDGTTITIEWKEFGVKVDFTPTVQENGTISLKVAPEVSQIDFSNPLALSGFSVPTIVTRRTSTTVLLDAGEHLVIGGLKQTDKLHKVKRVPVLGQIPLLDVFFRHTDTESVERELLVVVSPEIIEGSAAMPKLPTDAPAPR